MTKINGTNSNALPHQQQKVQNKLKAENLNILFTPSEQLKEANEFLNRDYYIKGDTIFKVKRDTIYINKSDFDPSKVSVEELDKKIAQLSEPFDEKVLNFNYGYTRLITEMSDMDNLVYERGNITKDGYVEPQDTVKVSRQEVTDYNNSLNLREIRDKKVENEFKDQNIKFVDGMFRSVKPDNY